jgi:hypothetical protein
MNVVTFNNSFERMMDAYPLKQYLETFRGWQHAPLFDYTTDYSHEKEQVDKMLDVDGMTIDRLSMPFNLFRLALVETAVPWQDMGLGVTIGEGRYATNYVVSRTDGYTTVLAEIKEMWDRTAVGALPNGNASIKRKIAFLINEVKQEPHDPAFQFQFSVCVDGHWISVLPELRIGMEPIVGAAVTALATFLVDAMAPTSHIATVRPNQPYRSLTWLKARTHYTLVTHGHPANQNSVHAGQRISSSPLEELTRMAHNRRSHKRTLRSERFRFARGKVIEIRATWVGPKAWQDEGGKQIYKILEPVGDHYEIPRD